MKIDAREYLRSFKVAETRIQLKARQAKDLQDRLLSISAPIDKEVVSHTPNVGIMADMVAMIVDMQKEIELQTADILRRKREVYLLLNKIDPEKASLLIDHFIEKKSLSEIGKIRHIERRWVKRRIASAIADFQIVLDRQEALNNQPFTLPAVNP